MKLVLGGLRWQPTIGTIRDLVYGAGLPHHALTNLVVEHDSELGLSSHHSRSGIFRISAQPGARRGYSNFIAASSVGKWPLVRNLAAAIWRSRILMALGGVR